LILIAAGTASNIRTSKFLKRRLNWKKKLLVEKVMLVYDIDLPHSTPASPHRLHNAMAYCQLLLHQCIVNTSFQ